MISSRSNYLITTKICVQKFVVEMTEQLIFTVFWSTQYNPSSIVLFSNESSKLLFFWSDNCLNIFTKQINYIKATTDEIFPIFTIALLIREAIFWPYFGDKALLKSYDNEVAYFDVLMDKLQCYFLKIKLPIIAQTSVA